MKTDLLDLLESKNRCLARFLELSRLFLARAENGDFSHLEDFHSERNSIIRALDLYDRQAERLATSAQSEDPRSKAKTIAAVRESLAKRDEVLEEILLCDREVIKRVEAERDRVSNELQSANKTHSRLSKFKSAWIPGSGGGLDGKA